MIDSSGAASTSIPWGLSEAAVRAARLYAVGLLLLALLMPDLRIMYVWLSGFAASIIILTSGKRLRDLYEARIPGFSEDHRLQLMWLTTDYGRLRRAGRDPRVQEESDLAQLAARYAEVYWVLYLCVGAFLVAAFLTPV